MAKKACYGKIQAYFVGETMAKKKGF